MAWGDRAAEQHEKDQPSTVTGRTRPNPPIQNIPGSLADRLDQVRERFRTPGYDGPEGTEWDRPPNPDKHVWGNDTHYPPTGGAHVISRCGPNCPPRETPAEVVLDDDERSGN